MRFDALSYMFSQFVTGEFDEWANKKDFIDEHADFCKLDCDLFLSFEEQGGKISRLGFSDQQILELKQNCLSCPKYLAWVDHQTKLRNDVKN